MCVHVTILSLQSEFPMLHDAHVPHCVWFSPHGYFCQKKASCKQGALDDRGDVRVAPWSRCLHRNLRSGVVKERFGMTATCHLLRASSTIYVDRVKRLGHMGKDEVPVPILTGFSRFQCPHRTLKSFSSEAEEWSSPSYFAD